MSGKHSRSLADCHIALLSTLSMQPFIRRWLIAYLPPRRVTAVPPEGDVRSDEKLSNSRDSEGAAPADGAKLSSGPWAFGRRPIQGRSEEFRKQFGDFGRPWYTLKFDAPVAKPTNELFLAID